MWLGLFTESFSETAESLHLDRGCEICELAEKMVEIVCEFMAVVSLLSCFIWRKGSWDGNISADKTFEWPDYDNFTIDCSWWYFFYFLFLFLRWERQTDKGNHLKLKEMPICEGKWFCFNKMTIVEIMNPIIEKLCPIRQDFIAVGVHVTCR